MMDQTKILPTSDLGFRKIFSTRGKEHILQGFLQDIFDADKVGIKITNIHVGNPYNIIDVNKLSADERKSLLLQTELDIHCIADNNYEIAIEMQIDKDKYMEERIFNNSALKYTTKYDKIFYESNELEDAEMKKKESKYAGLAPVISLNIFRHHHFKKSQRALHFFRLYDTEDKKYTLNPHRYTEVYFELKKQDVTLSNNLKAWRYFMLTGGAIKDSPSYIKEAAEMLKISNLTREERRLYDIYERNRQKMLSREEYVFDQGIEQGASEKAIELARKFLSMGLSEEIVSKGTGFDLETLQKLA